MHHPIDQLTAKKATMGPGRQPIRLYVGCHLYLKCALLHTGSVSRGTCSGSWVPARCGIAAVTSKHCAVAAVLEVTCQLAFVPIHVPNDQAVT